MKKIFILIILICNLAIADLEKEETQKIIEEITNINEIQESIDEIDEILIRNNLINFAKEKLDMPYKWGSIGPDKFDCSGFVNYIFNEKTDISLPRVSSDISKYNDKKSVNDLEIGDLLFFNTSKKNKRINHVGIYIGDGNFIHASSAKKKVLISTINEGFYKKTFRWAISPFK